MRNHRLAAVIVSGAFAVTTLAGCGGGDSKNSGTKPSAGQTTSRSSVSVAPDNKNNKVVGPVLSEADVHKLWLKAGCSDADPANTHSAKVTGTYRQLGVTNFEFCVTKKYHMQVMAYHTEKKGQIGQALATDAIRSNFPANTPVIVGTNWSITVAPNGQAPDKTQTESVRDTIGTGEVSTFIVK